MGPHAPHEVGTTYKPWVRGDSVITANNPLIPDVLDPASGTVVDDLGWAAPRLRCEVHDVHVVVAVASVLCRCRGRGQQAADQDERSRSRHHLCRENGPTSV